MTSSIPSTPDETATHLLQAWQQGQPMTWPVDSFLLCEDIEDVFRRLPVCCTAQAVACFEEASQAGIFSFFQQDYMDWHLADGVAQAANAEMLLKQFLLQPICPEVLGVVDALCFSSITALLQRMSKLLDEASSSLSHPPSLSFYQNRVDLCHHLITRGKALLIDDPQQAGWLNTCVTHLAQSLIFVEPFPELSMAWCQRYFFDHELDGMLPHVLKTAVRDGSMALVEALMEQLPSEQVEQVVAQLLSGINPRHGDRVVMRCEHIRMIIEARSQQQMLQEGLQSQLDQPELKGKFLKM